ncbi:sensor histidine kinase [Chryseolinea lacunae]|uniref:histidine kinase n=1 Tax=Chryseolinea lacunae TaxID=2801331 RepID=A0ABS1KNA9_9BACT|nr:HAMP domain-containing sensor histidine kinase [Chryseolinea lacunae]MBL0740824.1 HAMP domain-containing histidine kinase [Chryseolinea lacunae]
MNYKTRLTLLFVGLFFFVLSSILVFIYISYSEFRRDEFFERLREKSFNTAKLLIDVKEIDIGLLKIIDQNSINKMYDEKILIFDENNALIYSSLDDEKIPYSTKTIEHIRRRADKYYVDEDGDEVVGVHYTGQGHDYVVLASAYDRYGISKLENLKNLVIIALMLGTALIALSSYIYIRQVFRPIDTLNASIQNISENNLHEFIAVKKNRDELDRLALNYNQMLARLFKAFESQRAFVRNAAHELKTPLALIHTKLDRLDELAGSHPEMQILLSSLEQDVDGQAALVESLLLIQRLQSQLPVNTAKVRIDESLYESVKDGSVSFPHQTVKIDIESSIATEDQLTVQANALLLKICFRNLIANAAMYAATPELNIILSKAGQALQLAFVNAGDEAIPDTRIFEPFYRQTQQQEKPGHGLGLSIVKQIIELMQGTIAYRFEAGRHHFVLTLPHA